MDTFAGMSSVQSFSPGWARHELLEKTLAGRKQLVDRLEELALDGAGGRRITLRRRSGQADLLPFDFDANPAHFYSSF